MSKFQVGDKVRLMQRDTVHTIIRVVDECRGLYKLSDGFETWGGQYLELVAPTDPKREFLERLQSLMREFDAKISINGYEVSGLLIEIGDTGVYYNMDEYSPMQELTADTIMDFDKE